MPMNKQQQKYLIDRLHQEASKAATAFRSANPISPSTEEHNAAVTAVLQKAGYELVSTRDVSYYVKKKLTATHVKNNAALDKLQATLAAEIQTLTDQINLGGSDDAVKILADFAALIKKVSK